MSPGKTKQRTPLSARKRRSKKTHRGFIVPFAGGEDYQMGREFLNDPQKLLQRLKLRLSNLECPEEVHAAMRRGEAFVKAASSVGTPAASLRRVRSIEKLAAKYLGKDFEVAAIPFGLKFCERIPYAKGLDWTATGSGTITFFDSDPDVDG